MTTKADAAAADRLLKAAVKRAREVIAGADEVAVRDWAGDVCAWYRDYDKPYIEAMLATACTAADLLLDGAS